MYFTHALTGIDHHGHALAGCVPPPLDKARVKFEAQRLAKLREGERTLDLRGGHRR